MGYGAALRFVALEWLNRLLRECVRSTLVAVRRSMFGVGRSAFSEPYF